MADAEGTERADVTPEFPVCGQCPTREACEAAGFCVIESRFGRADLSIGELTCRSCGQGSESAWMCAKGGGDCDASSQLWGEWFLVRSYANDARRAVQRGQVDRPLRFTQATSVTPRPPREVPRCCCRRPRPVPVTARPGVRVDQPG